MDASDGIPFESKRCAAKYDVQSELVKSFLLQINAKMPEGEGTPKQIDVELRILGSTKPRPLASIESASKFDWHRCRSK